MLTAVLEGAKEQGCIIQCIDLNTDTLDQIKFGGDDELVAALREAECLVLASPTYWGNVSGSMKLFLDNLRSELVHYSSKGDLLPGSYQGKGYVLITSCTAKKWTNRLSGITDQTFKAMDLPLSTAGMHRLFEAVCADTYGVHTLPPAKYEACKKIGAQIPKQMQRGGFTLKRYIQLFFMLAVTILIVMGIQQGLSALHIIQLHQFWINYLSFVVLSYLFLSIMLRYFAVLKHRRS
ncbi:NAD(P)H-dependent oxidoreductase [Sporolactobacillus shoreicorticis]|uniref:Flavodoxin family protein n=1 Tax=Sporolactobacillus shoreicorticis TaxID=1923877 RepID=A0ABW5S211_9BACL|nr:NAD(P)H-dependent oxidoreductase [Sporolactobacillus shoreicorticis]MCO7125403.1 NAD(P)H-dependent oxidoreductase [Sporolactobacillus shoreicorticis]